MQESMVSSAKRASQIPHARKRRLNYGGLRERIYRREKTGIAEGIIISGIHYRRAVFLLKQASGFFKPLFNPAPSLRNFSFAAVG